MTPSRDILVTGATGYMLKSSGRGIFLIRSFMDDVQLMKGAEGGMEVRMVKKLAKATL